VAVPPLMVDSHLEFLNSSCLAVSMLVIMVQLVSVIVMVVITIEVVSLFVLVAFSYRMESA
jgi:hypothetical protein